jgi:hypothetical protein
MEALRAEVSARRREYLAALRSDGSEWGESLPKWHPDNPTAVELFDMNGAARAFLRIQQAKLAYEEALDRFRTALNDRSQKRSEAMQISMTRASWAIVFLTFAIGAARVLQACQ